MVFEILTLEKQILIDTSHIDLNTFLILITLSKSISGMPFKDLFRECRQAFLVSTDAALRTQLTEFVDHKVVTIKRNNIDGIEYLNIPLDSSLLKKFLEEHDKSD